MGFLKSLVWPLLKPTIAAWLTQCALVLPVAAVHTIATKANVSPDVVILVEAAIRDYATSEFDRFKP